jgi:hypothetical protein
MAAGRRPTVFNNVMDYARPRGITAGATTMNEKVYKLQRASAGRPLLFCGLAILVGLGCGSRALHSLQDGHIHRNTGEGLFGSTSAIGLGFWIGASIVLRFPRVRLSDDRLIFQELGGSQSAAWTSLGAFQPDRTAISPDKQTALLVAPVIGADAHAAWKKAGRVQISTQRFNVNPAALCREMNAYRENALAKSNKPNPTQRT